MRSVILIVVILVSLVATNQLWFSRSSGWSDGKTQDMGDVPHQYPGKANVWEKWGLLGYVEWRGTSAPPGPSPEGTLFETIRAFFGVGDLTQPAFAS